MTYQGGATHSKSVCWKPECTYPECRRCLNLEHILQARDDCVTCLSHSHKWCDPCFERYKKERHAEKPAVSSGSTTLD